MVLYMHVILFMICLNLGLGITAIPNTPLYISQASSTVANNCFNIAQDNLIEYDGTAWVRNVNANATLNSPVQQMADMERFTDQFGGTYDPVTQAIDAGYQTIDLVKGVILGGFVINAIDTMTLHCDFSPENATGSVVVDDPVMQYFKAALQVIFGLMIALLILYLVTGKGFGL